MLRLEGEAAARAPGVRAGPDAGCGNRTADTGPAASPDAAGLWPLPSGGARIDGPGHGPAPDRWDGWPRHEAWPAAGIDSPEGSPGRRGEGAPRHSAGIGTQAGAEIRHGGTDIRSAAGIRTLDGVEIRHGGSDLRPAAGIGTSDGAAIRRGASAASAPGSLEAVAFRADAACASAVLRTLDAIIRSAGDLEPASRTGAPTGAGHGGSPFMSEDPDPPDTPPGNVARLHPPGLPHQASLDRAVQAQIGAQLRSMYEHYVEQPIPDRLIDLVRRLGETQDPGAGRALAAADAPGQRGTFGATSGGAGGPARGHGPSEPPADPRRGGEES